MQQNRPVGSDTSDDEKTYQYCLFLFLQSYFSSLQSCASWLGTGDNPDLLALQIWGTLNFQV